MNTVDASDLASRAMQKSARHRTSSSGITGSSRELENRAYPRVVRDAIEETLQRYRRDVAYLEKELGTGPAGEGV